MEQDQGQFLPLKRGRGDSYLKSRAALSSMVAASQHAAIEVEINSN